MSNGASSRPAPPAGAAAKVPSREARLAQVFAQVVAVLMRDPNYRRSPLADLEWLALPPLMAGQFRPGQAPAPINAANNAQKGGMLTPVAVALWARVSADIDAALSASPDRSPRLKPT
jgi:hemolysin-activating ACP:hemolysin acyltransferase